MKTLMVFTVLLFSNYGCKSGPNEPTKGNDFAIYLTLDIENNVPTEVSIENLILEDEPILSLSNITTYDWSNHKINFSDEAKENIKLKEPLYSRVFIVEAKGQRIYWGLFTCGISSASCNNPVISVFSTHGMDTSFISNSFVIDRGYPEYRGNENDPDLREDHRIYTILKNSSKLK
jgi:hypothetical protein